MLSKRRRIRLTGAGALFLLASAGVCAPQQGQSNPFYKELTPAWQLYHVGKLDEAAAAFRTVLERATAAQDRQAQAWAQDALGIIFSDKSDFAAARAAYERAREFYKAVPDPAGEAVATQQLGEVASSVGDLATAREYFRTALTAFERLGLLHLQAVVMGELALAREPRGDQLNQRALEIANQLGDRKLQADILHRVGDNSFMRGLFDTAEQYYDQAVTRYQEVGDRRSLARVLTSQGRLQRAHGHGEKALELYGQALKIQQDIHDQFGAIQSINAMAVAWQLVGDGAKAIVQYQQALGMARETGSQRFINFELGNLAGAYIGQGKPLEGVEILEKLLHDNPNLEWTDLRLMSLSSAYYKLGRYSQGIEMASRAIEMMGGSRNPGALPDALFWRAKSEVGAGDRQAAIADAQASLQAIEDLRAHLVPSDFMKRGFADQTQKVFSFTIGLLAAAGRNDRALEVAEEARARAFLDLLATRSLQDSQGELAAAAGEMSDPALVESPDAGTRTATQKDTSALWRQWTSVDTELSSGGSAKPVTFAGVQATAHRLNSTVLSYWVSEDTTFVWVVSPSGEIHAASTAVSPAHLRKLITALWPTGDAALAPEASSRNNWRELYRLLIQPVEKWLPAQPGSLLTIEPYGPLLTLPFAALKDAQGRYLLERFTLHYVPAISLLEFTREKPAEAGPAFRRFLLIADPAGTPNGADGKTLAALPGARREVAAVAKLLPVAQVTLLEGKQASEQRVRELAGISTVVHFATHGIIRVDRPFDSFLALGSSGPGKQQDGRLTAEEVYVLRLKSELVFLSACRSGLGRVTGDGTVGLTRAFLYAGTPSVIASLWDVADEPTYRLIPAFYRVWQQGKSKSAALRSAQLEVLHALRAGKIKIHTVAGDVVLPEDPVFWASFALQGAP